MSTLQINLHAEHDESIDDYVDSMQAELARSDENLIIDSRLGWHFFKDAFKVNLIVDPATGASRAISRPASDVEAYASIDEAVRRLQVRSDSERARYLQKYGVDKTRLRNFHLICDTTSAQPSTLVDEVLAAARESSKQKCDPILLLDPGRIYPSERIGALRGLWESDLVAEVRPRGYSGIDSISVGYTGSDFYVLDGHRRLSAALQCGFPLISARLIAEFEEHVIAGFSAQQYFESSVSISMVYDWEAAHGIVLSLPGHLASRV
jgi:cytidylate kinase